MSTIRKLKQTAAHKQSLTAHKQPTAWLSSIGPVENLDLVQRAYALAKSRPNARLVWIKAHDGARWNEYADGLATSSLR